MGKNERAIKLLDIDHTGFQQGYDTLKERPFNVDIEINKCYLCGRTKEDLIAHWDAIRKEANILLQDTDKLLNLMDQDIHRIIDPILKATENNEFLDLKMDTLQREYETFVNKIPHLDLLLRIGDDTSWGASKDFDSLAERINLLKEIASSPSYLYTRVEKFRKDVGGNLELFNSAVDTGLRRKERTIPGLGFGKGTIIISLCPICDDLYEYAAKSCDCNGCY